MKRPWFKLWVADWNIDTSMMTLEEQGAYMRLLTIQWRDGSVPTDVKKLALGLGVPTDHFTRELLAMVEARFPHGVNPRLEREKQGAEAVSASNSINGSKGGRPANKYESERLANEKQEPKPDQSLSEIRVRDQKDPEETLERPRVARPRFDFAALYDQYPNKKGKVKGLEKLKALVKTEAEFQAVKHGLECFIADEKRKGTETKYIPHFSTWVNGKRWEDYPLPAASEAVGGSEARPVETRQLTARERHKLAEAAERGLL